MKEILWADMTGAVATGALVQVAKSKTVLSNVTDLDLWVEAGLIAVDVFASEHMGDLGAGFLNGAGTGAAALMAATLMDKFVLPTPKASVASVVTGSFVVNNASTTTNAQTSTNATSSSGTATNAVATPTVAVSSGVPSQSTNS